MHKFKEVLKNHKVFSILFLLIYSIGMNIILFPFSNELFTFDFEQFLRIIIGYGIVGMIFSLTLKSFNIIKGFLLALFFTIIGMVFKYLLEFGEISNIRNFTINNIFLFLLVVPLYTSICYYLSNKIFFDK